MNTPIAAARRVAFLLSVIAITTLTQAADVRVYVRYLPGQKGAAKSALVQGRGRVHHDFDRLGAIAVSLPEEAVEALRRNPAVAAIEDDPVRYFQAQPVPWGIAAVQAPEAVRQLPPKQAKIIVGVIDSGVFRNHEDLKDIPMTGDSHPDPNLEGLWDRDLDSHGTHVVGTIAAVDNAAGVLGVSHEPGAVGIHMVKILGDTGRQFRSSDVVAAAQKAQAAGAKIINMSLGGPGFDSVENQFFKDLYDNKGVLLVAASGNHGDVTETLYPAGYASVISVAAIKQDKTVAEFSHRNIDVELAAPGVAVNSTFSFTDVSSIDVVGTGVFRDVSHVLFSKNGATMPGALVDGAITGPASWHNGIVLIDTRPSPSPFPSPEKNVFDQVQLVKSAGGLGCIFITSSSFLDLRSTLGYSGPGVPNSSDIPAVTVSPGLWVILKSYIGIPPPFAVLSSTRHDNVSTYQELEGTSMAAAHVSGVAALIWSKYPTATNAQVRMALNSSALDLGAPDRDPVFGWGLVQAAEALTELKAIIGANDEAKVTLSNLSQTFDEKPKSVGYTTVPPGLTVKVTYEGITVTYPKSSTPPSALGSYAVEAIVEDAKYAGNATGTLEITPFVSLKIITDPVKQEVVAGKPATFTVVAEASHPISYQWFKDAKGVKGMVPGATTATLMFATAQVTDEGKYYVIVLTAADGKMAESKHADLTVRKPPTITRHPAVAGQPAGGDMTFSVVVEATRKPLNYQWQKEDKLKKEGVPMAGETNAKLTLKKITAADAGRYRVVVSNVDGEATSNYGELTVRPPPK